MVTILKPWELYFNHGNYISTTFASLKINLIRTVFSLTMHSTTPTSPHHPEIHVQLTEQGYTMFLSKYDYVILEIISEIGIIVLSVYLFLSYHLGSDHCISKYVSDTKI